MSLMKVAHFYLINLLLQVCLFFISLIDLLQQQIFPMIFNKLLDQLLDIGDLSIASSSDHRTPSIDIFISPIEA